MDELSIAQLRGMALRRGCYVTESIRAGRWILVRPSVSQTSERCDGKDCVLAEVDALPLLIPHLDEMPIVDAIGLPGGTDPIDVETPMPGLLEDMER